MGRPLRLEFAGALYHLTSRGDRSEDIYLDDADLNVFLEVFAEICERFAWTCHGYCLMTSYYRSVIETREAALSRGMQRP